MFENHRPFAVLTFAALTACSTYDFAAARLPDGSYDTKKLIADLDASGERRLSSGIWIPLIWLDLETFERNDPTLPEGYTHERLTSFGPVFFGGSLSRNVVDTDCADVESRERDWFGWGGLFFDEEEDVATTHGNRHEGRSRFLLLFGGRSRFYAGLADRAD